MTPAPAWLPAVLSFALQVRPPPGGLDPREAAALRPEGAFATYCASCHGEAGDGLGRYWPSDLAPAPAALADPGFLAARTDERLLTAVLQGSAAVGGSTACPAWGGTLGPVRARALVAWLRAAGEAPAAAPEESPAHVAPVPLEPAPRPSALPVVAVCLLLLVTAVARWRRHPLPFLPPPDPDQGDLP